MVNNNLVKFNDDALNENGMNANNSVNNVSPGVIICDRCGSPIKKESRYCMKCGNLNYLHPENESMKKYAPKNDTKVELDVYGNVADNSVSKKKSERTNNLFKTCFIVNLVLHILLAIVCILPIIFVSKDLMYIVGIILFIGYLFIYNYSMQCILIKGGQVWWSYYVPLYSNFTFYEVAMGNGWLSLISFIPGIGIIMGMIANYKLGKRFYKSGWLTLLFPFIMIPVVGLDKKSELSIFVKKGSVLDEESIEKHGKSKSETDYKVRKFVIIIISIILGVIILYFGWPYIKIVLEPIYEFLKEQMEFYK